ncbi:calponin homology domain-containing protein [Geopyxis carbonaria]|nr:calponin homology domain-containing protein [Geopyxis carbonaria]
MPLQPNLKPPQRGTAIGAVRERNSGKENAPPGENRATKRAKTSQELPARRSARLSGDGLQLGSINLNQQTQKIPLKPTIEKSSQRQSKKRNSDFLSFDDTSFTSESSCGSRSLRLIKRQRISSDSIPSPPSLTAEEEAELVPPSDFLISGLVSQKPTRKSGSRRLDPVLRDDLVRCEMYEESWLSAQESSVTQLLNQLLEEYSPAPIGKPRLSLRQDFLKMYSAAPFPLVYNRVHASLLYGALSITQSLIEKSSSSRLSRATANTLGHLGWGNDLGLKTKFLDLFVGSYEHSALVTALEVVIGREMFAFADPGDSEKKIMEGYIERYLIKSEDILATIPTDMGQKKRKGVHIDGGDEDRGSPAWLLRRSLLRSFMLVLLLDKAKLEGIMGKQCLFKKSSTHKSSAAILSAISRLLLPSMGEVSKPLSHLNYTVTISQTPLTEYCYMIDNIAIDMRDGVRLARVVEVLLNSKRRTSNFSDQSTDTDDDWPLTPHLQYPAQSRAQKLHNVSLILSTLARAQGNPNHIEARDIVDGHREKTVGLLWSLLSRWGLELLVDWESVKDEIRRFERLAYPGLFEEDNGSSNTAKKDHPSLLKDWARCVGSKHGLVVNNLTTSFADGRVFETIVNEYQQYLPSLAKTDKSATLETKLKSIGCNSYFGLSLVTCNFAILTSI